MNTETEKAQLIINTILRKYKKKIPIHATVIELGTTYRPRTVRSLPLQLESFRCIMPNISALQSIIHEQLHLWYALCEIADGKGFNYLKKKYIDPKIDEDGDLITDTIMKDVELTDPKTGKVTVIPTEVDNGDYDLAVSKYKIPMVLSGTYPTLEHMIVIWNELNIITPLITKREYDWLYYKYKGLHKHTSLFQLTYWVMRNFQELEYDLSRYGLIWSSKDNIKSNSTVLTMDQMVSMNPLPGV